MNQSLLQDGSPSFSTTCPPESSTAFTEVRATIKSGLSVVGETTLHLDSVPYLGLDFDVRALTDILPAGYGALGCIMKIGFGSDGLREIEIVVEPEEKAAFQRVVLNSGKVPHDKRGVVVDYLSRRLGTVEVRWNPPDEGPLVVGREPSGLAPVAGELEEGIRSMIACPLTES